MKRFLQLLGAVVVAIVVVLVVNTMRSARAADAAVAPVAVAVDSIGAIARFSKALTFPTISYDPGTHPTDSAAFRALHAHFVTSFPLVHQKLKRETIGLALLYSWPGSDPSLDPVVLMGHQDVVPVIPGTENRWEQPPFSGVVDGGYIWGRGSLDDKVSVLAILESIEGLLRAGFQPKHTIYLAFGHDEEIGGHGAETLRDTLMARGLKHAALVIDEGGTVTDGAALGVTGKVALIGVAEKGYLTLELTANGKGGHSSTPPAHSAIGVLATAITKLEASPFPMTLDGPTEAMLESVRARMPFSRRLALSNLWLLRGAVVRALSAAPMSASMMRTTTAVTIIGGGVKANVLPIDAKASVNFRIRPGESVASVTARVVQTINDTSVHVVAVGFAREPSTVSDAKGAGFAAISQSVREVMGGADVTVAPFLLMAGTDARAWSAKSSQVFRFIAAPPDADVLTRVHGTNERVTPAAYLTAVRFFDRLVHHTDDLP